MDSTSRASSSCSSVSLPVRHVTLVDDDLANRAPVPDGLLDHGRGRLVADVAVERRDDRRRPLGEGPGVLDLGRDAVDAAVRQQA